MPLNETSKVDLVSNILEQARTHAGDAKDHVVQLSDIIEDMKTGQIAKEEGVLLCGHELGQARVDRMEAVLLAMATKNWPEASTIEPQYFSAGTPTESLSHHALYDHYQMCALVEAFAKGRISIQDFGTICEIAQDSFSKYQNALARENPKPNELATSRMWKQETANMLEELGTYEKAVKVLSATA